MHVGTTVLNVILGPILCVVCYYNGLCAGSEGGHNFSTPVGKYQESLLLNCMITYA